MAVNEEKAIENKQETTPGLNIVAGEISTDYDNKSWSELIKDYTQMRNGDPIISTTMDILKLPILNSERKVTAGNNSDTAKAAKDYIDWTFDNIVKGFRNLTYHKLLSLDFGSLLHEKIWLRGEKFNGKTTNVLKKMSPIMPETIDEWLYNDLQEFTGIKHQKRIPNKGSEQITIESGRLNWLTFNEEFNDMKGRSLLRPIRLVWESSVKVLIAKVITTQRGAGITAIGVDGDLSSSKKDIEKVGRTIATGASSYIAFDKSKMEVNLLQPQNQADVMKLLEFLDRNKFFNVLAQFLTSGIGQNGSRASTESLKAPYEMAATYIKSVLEANFQELVNEIIDNSFLAGKIQKEEYPIFTFSALSQMDILKMSQALKNLADSKFLIKTPEDEQIIRNMAGLPVPELKQQTGAIEDIEKDEEIAMDDLCGCGCGQKETKLSDRPAHECEFRLEEANEILIDIQKSTEKQLNSIMVKMLSDVSRQLKGDKNKSIDLRYRLEMQKKMIRQFENAFDIGQDDVRLEFERIGGKIGTQLALTPGQEENKNKRIKRAIDRLFFNIKNSLEDKLETINDAVIKRAGGLDSYIMSFADKFKGDKRKIYTEVDAGYIAGRSDTQKLIEKDVPEWFYSARLDQNLCIECAKNDGQILTAREIFDTPNIQLSGENVNLDCLGLLGKNKCRCVLIPFRTENV
jgi:hypothetical protein